MNLTNFMVHLSFFQWLIHMELFGLTNYMEKNYLFRSKKNSNSSCSILNVYDIDVPIWVTFYLVASIFL
jgi:hypothetical protein